MKILFYSMEGIGHVTACVNFAKHLKWKRGHDITFLIGSEYKGNFHRKYGFNELIIVDPEEDHPDKDGSDDSKQSIDDDQQQHPVLPKIVERLKNSIVLKHKTPEEKLQQRDNGMFKRIYEKMKRINNLIENILIDENNGSFDLIIIDHFIIPPSISFNKLNIPWIYLFSGCPDFLYNDPRLPPPMSGLPSNDKTLWPYFRELFEKNYEKPMKLYQNLLNEHFGFPPESEKIFFNKSSLLNLYSYPLELDYIDVIDPRPETFLQLDSFFDYEDDDDDEDEDELKKNERKSKLIRKLFKNSTDFNGKLIYITLGSCGSIDIELMKSICNSLADLPSSKYKFIVSKGPRSDEYELPSNCENWYGKSWLDQRSILPLVDLVLFHGGNNTLSECLMYAKPMLVMPLFFDQYSNAQRIEEKNFGYRLDPYNFSNELLCKSIETLLEDQLIRENLLKASKRIKSSKSADRACLIIENLVDQQQHPKQPRNLDESEKIQ